MIRNPTRPTVILFTQFSGKTTGLGAFVNGKRIEPVGYEHIRGLRIADEFARIQGAKSVAQILAETVPTRVC